jgi:ribonuclease HIII
MNPVFGNIDEGTYEEIKSILCSNFESYSKENIVNCLEASKFTSSGKSLSVRYYKSKKLMLQGNFNGMDELIKEIERKIKIKPNETKKDVNKINKDVLIGFDESGKGETFGSMFVCGVRIKSEDMEYIVGMLGGKDIKKLNKSQIEGLFNTLKDKFSYELIQVSVNEIDLYPINVILDRNYVSLLNKLKKESAKEAIIIDDYGIGFELSENLKKAKQAGSEIIIETKADMKYSASALASLVARRARLLEMNRLSMENIIIDPENGEKVFFQSGAPSNSETEKYLISCRKLCPYSEFPIFVRKKWKNVQEIEKRFPKKRSEIVFSCPDCKKDIFKICIYFCQTDKKTKCFCSLCGKEISSDKLKNFFSKNPIIIDTSALISRIISKDLATSNYLKACNFVIPSIAYEEMDSKQPDKKTGGTNEIQYIRQHHKLGLINLQSFEVEDYSEVANDKKFLRVMKAKNGIMLTQDKNLSGFSTIGDFVIQIIENKEIYMEKNLKKI